MSKYRWTDEEFETFTDAACRWLKCWGVGGGCLSLETVLKDIRAPDRESWLKAAKEKIQGYGWLCAECIDRLLDTLNAEIEELA